MSPSFNWQGVQRKFESDQKPGISQQNVGKNGLPLSAKTGAIWIEKSLSLYLFSSNSPLLTFYLFSTIYYPRKSKSKSATIHTQPFFCLLSYTISRLPLTRPSITIHPFVITRNTTNKYQCISQPTPNPTSIILFPTTPSLTFLQLQFSFFPPFSKTLLSP